MGRRTRLIKISSEIQGKRSFPIYIYIHIVVGTRGRIFRVSTIKHRNVESYSCRSTIEGCTIIPLIQSVKYPRRFLNVVSEESCLCCSLKIKGLLRVTASNTGSFLILEWKLESWRYTRDRNVNEASAMLHRVSPGFVSIILHVRSYVRPRVRPGTVHNTLCIIIWGPKGTR